MFRHNDYRFPFLWEQTAQPAARWHRDNAGPVQYFADTPAGAWAEFLRHEEITDPLDLVGVTRALWAVQIEDLDAGAAAPQLPMQVMRGGPDSYPDCRDEADRLRARGARGLVAPSAALREGAAAGWRVEHGLIRDGEADGKVLALFGARPDLVGWLVVDSGRPPNELLDDIRPLLSGPAG